MWHLNFEIRHTLLLKNRNEKVENVTMAKHMYSFLLKINFKAAWYCLLFSTIAVIASACGSTSESNMSQTTDAPTTTSHKIAIVNESGNVINAIKYKPCGASDSRYQYLTGNLRPNEKLSINIYSQCVDLIATNAFKKNLVDVKNVDLKQIKTWTIK
ncbi:MAG: hypothetical protein AMJ55_02765 [Gammaproteobacteria bacterium SG8_15]|nr:MAG: hypothetical protein AMJ55_02765 [Gammaproteobacteria bacterium SG8_15]